MRALLVILLLSIASGPARAAEPPPRKGLQPLLTCAAYLSGPLVFGAFMLWASQLPAPPREAPVASPAKRAADRITELKRQIRNVEFEISLAVADGKPTHELEDQRDAALEELYTLQGIGSAAASQHERRLHVITLRILELERQIAELRARLNGEELTEAQKEHLHLQIGALEVLRRNAVDRGARIHYVVVANAHTLTHAELKRWQTMLEARLRELQVEIELLEPLARNDADKFKVEQLRRKSQHLEASIAIANERFNANELGPNRLR